MKKNGQIPNDLKDLANKAKTASQLEPSKDEFRFNEQDIENVQKLVEFAKAATYRNEQAYIKVIRVREQLVKKIKSQIKQQ